jgi:hypothetical protein
MNFATLLTLLAAGFGVSFIVLDVSRVAARNHWPATHVVWSDNFRPFAVFLALFAGPALFAQAVWRMHAKGGLAVVDTALAVVIAIGWAGCYGLVVARCAGWLGMTVL